MKILILSIFLYLLPSTEKNDSAIISLRNLYYASTLSEAKNELLLKTTETAPVDETIKQSYKAMSYMLKAKYTYNPYSKLSNFNRGTAMLDRSIANSPTTLEARFLRFCVQTNAPTFLGYNESVESDKKMILLGWKKLTDEDLKRRIKEFMLSSNACTLTEKKYFNEK